MPRLTDTAPAALRPGPRRPAAPALRAGGGRHNPRHAIPVVVRTGSLLVHVASLTFARMRRISEGLLGRDPLLPHLPAETHSSPNPGARA